MESLSKIVSMHVEYSTLDGIKVSIRENGLVISNLQYVDDPIFFLGATMRNGLALKNLLTRFEMISGLPIKIHESILYKVRNRGFLELAWVLVCEVETFPYIWGSLLGREVFLCLFEKVARRLVGGRPNAFL